MDKYTIAPPSGSTNNSVGTADRPWHEEHFDSVKLNGGDLGEYLAESTEPWQPDCKSRSDTATQKALCNQ